MTNCNNCQNMRHIETMLEETAKLAVGLKQERDEAQKEALYYKTRYELLKDGMNVFAAVEKTEQDLQQ